MAYSKFLSTNMRTMTKGKGNKLPKEVVERILRMAEIKKKIKSLEDFIRFTDHSIPYELPVGEYAWHEDRIKRGIV